MKISNKTKLLALSSLAIVTTISAIVIPIVAYNGNTMLNIDFSNTEQGNQNRVLYFLNDPKNIEQSKLVNQLKIKKDYQYKDRSFITVDEAVKNNWFEFELYSSFGYLLYKNNLGAELAYIKPNQTNSTYPVVGLKIFAGEYENYYEHIFEYNESSLNGFKQTNEEINTKNVVEVIKKNPKSFFQLKKDVGKIGDLGLYAKNIKSSDFEMIDNPILKKLAEYDYSLEISSIEVDKVIPSKLNLTYSIDFNDGKTVFKRTNEKVVLDNFDIELGKDDPKSKVENFITNNKSYLDSLKQFFKLNATEDTEIESIRKEFGKGNIIFSVNSNNISTITNAGLSIEFKNSSNEDTRKLSVFSNPYDSQIPMYRVFITSYKNTPLEYSKDYIIEGDKNDKFLPSKNQSTVEKFVKYLNDNNKVFDDFFEFSSITLKGPFHGKQISDIPFNIIQNAYNKYKENNKKYLAPFDFSIKVKPTLQLPQNSKNAALTELNNFVSSINDMKLETKIVEIYENQGITKFKVNVGLGLEENNLFIALDEYLTINVVGFKDESTYYKEQVDKVVNAINGSNQPNPGNKITNQNIQINLVSENGSKMTEANAIELMKSGQWTKIFKSVTVLNMPSIDYPEFDTNVNINIDFNQLLSLDIKQIKSIINARSIDLTLIISKGNQFKSIKTNFLFNSLFI